MLRSASVFGWAKCDKCKADFRKGEFMVVFKDVIECQCGRIRIVDFDIIKKALQINPNLRVLAKDPPAYSQGIKTQKEMKVSRVFDDFVENKTSWT